MDCFGLRPRNDEKSKACDDESGKFCMTRDVNSQWQVKEVLQWRKMKVCNDNIFNLSITIIKKMLDFLKIILILSIENK